MNALSITIGLRYAIGRSSDQLVAFISRISTIGLIIGVALLITVLSVMNGFERELKERILNLMPAMTLYHQQGIDDWQSLASQFQEWPEIQGVAPLIQAEALLVVGDTAQPTLLFGVDGDSEEQFSRLQDYLEPSLWQQWRLAPSGVLVGAPLARKLNLERGDAAVFLLPSANDFKNPKLFRVNIAGIYATGTELDQRMVVMDIGLLGGWLGQGGVQALRFSLDDLLQAPAIAWRMIVDLPREFYARTWLNTHGNLYQAIKMSRNMVVVVMTLIIAVAAFNLISSLVLVVVDKRGDVAILKTMGASRLMIVVIFLIHGIAIGIIGTAIGCLLGIGLSLAMPFVAQGVEAILGTQLLNTEVYPIDYLPSDLRLSDVLLVGGIALLISMLSSIYPAWRAASARPAEALHRDV